VYYGFFLNYSTWDTQVEIVFMVTMPFVLGYVTRRLSDLRGQQNITN
jgi:predicted Na+-dependent transporter